MRGGYLRGALLGRPGAYGGYDGEPTRASALLSAQTW
jgi:hypothetical protein